MLIQTALAPPREFFEDLFLYPKTQRKRVCFIHCLLLVYKADLHYTSVHCTTCGMQFLFLLSFPFHFSLFFSFLFLKSSPFLSFPFLSTPIFSFLEIPLLYFPPFLSISSFSFLENFFFSFFVSVCFSLPLICICPIVHSRLILFVKSFYFPTRKSVRPPVSLALKQQNLFYKNIHNYSQ